MKKIKTIKDGIVTFEDGWFVTVSTFLELYNNDIEDGLTLLEAANHYGKDSQSMIAIEEMSELAKELSKNKRGEDNVDHIAEEIADVEIMLGQLKILYACEKNVKEWKILKLDRLKGRMKDDQ